MAFDTAAPEDYAWLASANGMLTGQNTESGSPMSRIFDTIVEATEEAVWNALLKAPTVCGVGEHVLAGFRV